MLERLYIKNFALIEELELSFCESLNVLTGETGTGKSIVIDAVSVLLGGRAQAEFIRSGADKAVLEGVFYLHDQHPVFNLLKELDIEEEGQSIILTRELASNGRNTCRVNGRTLTLGQYRLIGLIIVDIHGQHDHQSLLQSHNHINILDQFGGTQHLEKIKEVKECYSKWMAAQKELEELKDSEHQRLQRIDFLNYQIAEITQARLKVGEIEELTREAKIQANAEKISNSLHLAYLHLFGGERELSAYELLSKALLNISEVKKIDPALEKLYSQLEPGLYIIEESSAELRKYLDTIDYSPQRLEELENRLQLIKDLCKKYGPEAEDVLIYAEKAKTELKKWESSAERAEELENAVIKYEDNYREKALLLSEMRKDIGSKLEEKITGELLELAMPHVRFSVQIETGESTAKGYDQVEFLISPNPGEPLLPVAKIASGGELSRIMLSLKTFIADIDDIGTLIFDEIDSGIGGKAVQKVAEKLEKISKSQQVICVTHSPLIAALTDSHLLLEKTVLNGRTKTLVHCLTAEQRIEELARMLGGGKQTDDLKRYAAQILKKI